jgi:hypothetical protein
MCKYPGTIYQISVGKFRDLILAIQIFSQKYVKRNETQTWSVSIQDKATVKNFKWISLYNTKKILENWLWTSSAINQSKMSQA